MKFENLKEDKFKDSLLKKEQMFTLNGGGTRTEAGQGCYTSTGYPFRTYSCDYAYDSIRTNADGSITTSYHDRTNLVPMDPAKCVSMG